jgi:hypothetical protein
MATSAAVSPAAITGTASASAVHIAATVTAVNRAGATILSDDPACACRTADHHDVLDALPPGKPVEHLRSVLVALGTLPARDEQLARLHRWITETIARRPNPDEQHLLRRYATWHVLRRLRGRLNGAPTTHHQFIAAKRCVHAALTLLDWLASRGRTLGTATELPAAILARMRGIHIAVAVAWQRASAGDWARYSAEVSRRLNHTNSPPNPRTGAE